MVERILGYQMTSMAKDSHLGNILNLFDRNQGEYLALSDRDNRQVDTAEAAKRLAYGS